MPRVATTFIQAIPKLTDAEIVNIVNDLLLPLPSYTQLSERGSGLLQAVLDRARVSLHEGSRTPLPSVKQARRFLDLAAIIAVEKRVASPADLLHFYCQFIEKTSLAKLSQEDCIYLIQHIAHALAASEQVHQKLPNKITNAQIATLRDQAVNILPTLTNVRENKLIICLQF